MSVRSTLAVPPPVSGVSQRPANLRQPTHAQASENAWFDVADGVGKRPGTEIERVFTSTPKQPALIGVLEYSKDERYDVVFNLSTTPRVRVFRIGGNEATTTVSSDAATYLAASSGTIRMCPIGREALLVNPAATAAVGTSASFTIERTRPDSDAVLSYTGTNNTTYVRAEKDSAAYPAGSWQYTPGSLTYAHINFNTLTSPWSFHNGYWDDTGYANPGAFRMAFRRVALTGFTAATWDNTAKTLTKTGAFTSYTYRPGDMIYISAGTGFTAGWYLITSRVSDNAITLSADVAGTADVAANSTDSDFGESAVCRIGIEVVVSVDFKAKITSGEISDMHGVAKAIQEGLRSSGASNACCAWVPQAAGGNFQITAPYRGSGAVAYRPAASGLAGVFELAGTSGQPLDNPADAQIFVGTGTLGTSTDSEPPLSRWTRVSPPSQSGAAPTPTTLPVRIQRTAENTISVDVSPWVGRIVGDTSSNPAPKLWTEGSAITSAIVYRNRLFLAGSSFVAGSEAGNFWNFYDTVTPNAVDSDPIDRTVGSSANVDIRRMAAFRESLVLVAPGGQYELSGGESLTPSTASITATTSVEASDVQPTVSGPFLHLAVPLGTFSGVREYLWDELRAASDTADITVEVPSLVPGTIRAMASSPESRTLVVLADADEQMYCYRWFFSGNDKIQSAWGMWQFAVGPLMLDIAASRGRLRVLNENTGVVAVSNAVGAARVAAANHSYVDGNLIYLSDSTCTPSIDGTAYVKVISASVVELYSNAGLTTPINITANGTVRWHLGAYFIESMSLARQSARSGYAYTTHLDRRLYLTGTHSAGTTTFTMPATPTVATGSSQIPGTGSTINAVVKPDGTVLTPNGYTSTTITVSGDHSGVVCTLGWQPNWSITLTRPFIRTSDGSIIQDDLGIESLAVGYATTRNMTVRAVQTAATDRDRTIANGTTATSGTLKTMLSGEASRTTYTITDAGPGPAFVTGIQMDIEHAPIGVVETRGGNRGR